MGAMRPQDFAWRPEALGRTTATGSVRIQWLGTAGFAIEHAGHTLLIDPYVTRASITRCLVAPLQPDRDAIRRCVPRADAIVVGHTHFDHVLDVPRIALMTGAHVYGSRSAAALCRAQGVAEARVECIEHDAGGAPVEREVGPFALRFIPSAHSPLLLGRVPFPGEIADCSDVPLRTEEYRCGAVFGVEIRVAGRTLYHLGSAELIDANVRMKNVDLLLMCVAGWTASHDFPERVGHVLAPGAVLFSHWDDFTRSIEKPARLLPAMQMPQLLDRLTCASGAAKLGMVPIFGEVWL
jgi:L-ascorbate metabolism protein UlaG (beta-lactamase superfamily)